MRVRMKKCKVEESRNGERVATQRREKRLAVVGIASEFIYAVRIYVESLSI